MGNSKKDEKVTATGGSNAKNSKRQYDVDTKCYMSGAYYVCSRCNNRDNRASFVCSICGRVFWHS